MSENKTYNRLWNRRMISNFWQGFAAFSDPVTMPCMYDKSHFRWSRLYTFSDDIKNLRSDFVKSYFTVIEEAKESDRRQLSLDLEGTIKQKETQHIHND